MVSLFFENLFGELLKTISRAGRSVKIASPWAGGELFFKLLEAIPEGVAVEMVLRAGESEDLKITPVEVFKEFSSRGWRLFLHPSLHAKFVLVDEKIAFVGSANLTDRGLDRFEEGNREAVAEVDNPKEVKKLLEFFETLKGEAVEVSQLAGIVWGETTPRGGKAVLFEPFGEGDFLTLRSEEGEFLVRLAEVKSVSRTAEGDLRSLPPKVFDERADWWRRAFLFALAREGGSLSVAEFDILGKVEKGCLERVLSPPQSGGLLFKADKGLLATLAKRDRGNRPMECPVYVGKGRGFEAYLELAEVWRRHASVFGITGSGKSYLTQRVVARGAQSPCGVRFFVVDPQGEYGGALKQLLGEDFDRLVSVKRIPNTLLPLSVDDFVELLESLGFSHLLKGGGSEARLLRDRVASYLKPLLGGAGFSQTPLGEFLGSLAGEFKDISRELEALKTEISALFGEEVLKNQPKVLRELLTDTGKAVEVYDLSEVLDTRSRLNAVGLLLKRLFFEKGKGRRVAVVEEAHNFAPERGFGEAEAGRRNLALLFLEKIASEGRKLNLGLWLVSQRPAQVNKYVLSQTNTHFLFRLVDRNDLSAVENYLSQTANGAVKTLPSLGIGECIATGLGFPFGLELRVE